MKYYHATTKECIAKIVKDGTYKALMRRCCIPLY